MRQRRVILSEREETQQHITELAFNKFEGSLFIRRRGERTDQSKNSEESRWRAQKVHSRALEWQTNSKVANVQDPWNNVGQMRNWPWMPGSRVLQDLLTGTQQDKELRGGEQDSGHQHPGQETDLRGLQGKLKPRKESAAPGASTGDHTAGNRHLIRIADSWGSPGRHGIQGLVPELPLQQWDLFFFSTLRNKSESPPPPILIFTMLFLPCALWRNRFDFTTCWTENTAY